MRIVKYLNLLLVACIFFPKISFAQDYSTASTDQLNQGLAEACNDPNYLSSTAAVTDTTTNEDLYYFYIEVRDKNGNKQIVDCRAYGQSPTTTTTPATDTTNVPHCKTCLSSEDFNAARVLNRQAEEIVEQVSCSIDEKTPLFSAKCAKEFGCNAVRSVFSLVGMSGAVSYMNEKLQKKIIADIQTDKTCLINKKSNCGTEAISGILKNIWTNIEGVGILAKVGASYAWNGAKKAGNKIKTWFSRTEVQEIEDKSSEAALAAGMQSEGFIKKFLTNPGLAIKEMTAAMYNWIMKAAADNFACAKRSGHSRFSKCEKYLDTWECATCDQRINTVCGVMGFIGGEIATAFLTGGTINIASKLGKSTKIARAFSALGSVISKSKIGRGVSYLGKIKVLTATGRIALGAGKAAVYLPLKTLKGISLIPGIKQYLYATEKAFMMGLKGPASYLAVRTATGTAVVTKADDVTRAARAAEALEHLPDPPPLPAAVVNGDLPPLPPRAKPTLPPELPPLPPLPALPKPPLLAPKAAITARTDTARTVATVTENQIKIEKFRKAKYLETSVKTPSTNHLLQTGKLYEEAGAYEDALRIYQKAKSQKDILRTQMGLFKKAKALERKYPDPLPIQTMKFAHYYEQAGTPVEALRLYKKADATSEIIHRVQRQIFNKAKTLERSITNPTVAQTKHLAGLYEEAGTYNHAVRLYEKIDDASGLARARCKGDLDCLKGLTNAGLTGKTTEVINHDGTIYVKRDDGNLGGFYGRTNRNVEELSEIYPEALIRPKKLKGKKVLDIGMGDGAYVEELRAANIDAHGIDIYLNEAQRNVPFLHKGDFLYSGLPDSEFDVIYSTYSLFSYHSTKKGFLFRAFSEAERILKADTDRTRADEIMNRLIRDPEILELIKKKL